MREFKIRMLELKTKVESEMRRAGFVPCVPTRNRGSMP
jgi:hypothetical protein